MMKTIIEKKRIVKLFLFFLTLFASQSGQAQDNVSLEFEDYKEVFIDTVDFRLKVLKDGVEDTNGEVECHYTVDGSEPTKTSVKTLSGHVFKSIFPFTLKIAYLKSDGELSDVITKQCDVTYSTSENYRNYKHNVLPHDSKGLTIFVRTGDMVAPSIYTWYETGKDEEGKPVFTNPDGGWPGTSIGAETTNKKGVDWMYNTYDTKEINMKLTWDSDDQWSSETGDFLGITSDTYFYYFGAGLINAADTYFGTDDKVAFFTPQISDRGQFPASGADDTSFRDASDAWTNVHCYAYANDGTVKPLGEWPGTKCELVGRVYMFTHLYNNDPATRRTVRKNIWKIDLNGKELPADVNLIFNDGESISEGNDKSTHESRSYTYVNGGLFTFRHTGGDANPIGVIQPGKFGESFGETSYTTHIPGDLTYLLNPDWEDDNTTAEITDDWSNWTGKPDAVTVNAPIGTATQTVEGLKAGKYMVQAIVRATKDSEITLKVNSNESKLKAKGMGNTVESEVNHFGRVDKLHTGEYGGWQKIECEVTLAGDGNNEIKIELSAPSGSNFQFSDVTLLENPNTKDMFWTTAPTSETATFADFSDRETYNKYSFFDRGANLNAIVKASPKTVIGMETDEYTYKKADETTFVSADHRHPVNVAYGESDAKCKHLYLTDTDGKEIWTNCHAFGSEIDFTAQAITYDRQFVNGDYATICLPYSLTADELQTLFGTGTHYDFKSIENNGATIHFTSNDGATEANKPFMIKVGTGDYLTKTIAKTDGLAVSKGQPEAGEFSGIFKFTPLVSYNTGNLYYIFDAEKNGTYKKVWDDAEGGDIKPFRAYVTATRSASAKPYMNIVFDDGNETTGITEIGNDKNADGMVYTIDGRRLGLRGSLRGSLKQGIYIINGKKTIVK